MDRPLIRRIDHISLRVRDLEASAAFYCDLFALRRGPTNPPSERTCRCQLSADETSGVELTQGRPAGAASTVDHFSFQVADAGLVDRVYERATTRGDRATPPRWSDGRRKLFVFDPDGHKIEVFAARSEPDPTERRVPAAGEARDTANA